MYPSQNLLKQALFPIASTHGIFTTKVNEMKGQVAVLMSIIVMQSICILLYYLPNMNPFPQRSIGCNQWKKFNIFARVLICKSRNLHHTLRRFSASCFLVRLYCTYFLSCPTVRSYCTYSLYYLAVWICVQRIIIIWLHWPKYSAPPVGPMKVVAATASCLPTRLVSQWHRSQFGVQCYHNSVATFIQPGLSLW